MIAQQNFISACDTTSTSLRHSNDEIRWSACYHHKAAGFNHCTSINWILHLLAQDLLTDHHSTTSSDAKGHAVQAMKQRVLGAGRERPALPGPRGGCRTPRAARGRRRAPRTPRWRRRSSPPPPPASAAAPAPRPPAAAPAPAHRPPNRRIRHGVTTTAPIRAAARRRVGEARRRGRTLSRRSMEKERSSET